MGISPIPFGCGPLEIIFCGCTLSVIKGTAVGLNCVIHSRSHHSWQGASPIVFSGGTLCVNTGTGVGLKCVITGTVERFKSPSWTGVVDCRMQFLAVVFLTIA